MSSGYISNGECIGVVFSGQASRTLTLVQIQLEHNIINDKRHKDFLWVYMISMQLSNYYTKKILFTCCLV